MSSTKFDDHLFANNPFRDNLKELLRENRKAEDARQDGSGAAVPKGARPGGSGKAVSGVSRKAFGRKKKAESPEYDDECSLFLSAMDGMRKVDDGKTGRRPEEMRFTLQEIENFPGSGRGKDDGEIGDLDDASFSRTPHSRTSARVQAKPLSRPQKPAAAATGFSPLAGKLPNVDKEQASSQAAASAPEEEMTMDRLLSGEEAPNEFLRAMDGVRPLQKAGREVPPAASAPALKYVAANVLQDIIDGKVEFELTFTDEYMEGYVVGVDPIIIGKLRQGGYSPEGNLDLHGLNSQEAFEALRTFIKSAWYRGSRCLLVVPGRGKNSPNGHAILRDKLKLWFTQDPFKRVILAFCTARPHDGGPGAVYVLLRKFKKKGRVAWERVPADEDLL